MWKKDTEEYIRCFRFHFIMVCLSQFVRYFLRSVYRLFMSKKMEECIIPKIKIIERRTIKNNIKIQYYRVTNTSTSWINWEMQCNSTCGLSFFMPSRFKNKFKALIEKKQSFVSIKQSKNIIINATHLTKLI